MISCTNQGMFKKERGRDKKKKPALSRMYPGTGYSVKSRRYYLWPKGDAILREVTISCLAIITGNGTIKNKI